jgi:hypothetical protein
MTPHDLPGLNKKCLKDSLESMQQREVPGIKFRAAHMGENVCRANASAPSTPACWPSLGGTIKSSIASVITG